MASVLLIDTLHPVFAQILNEHGIEAVAGHHLTRETILETISTYEGIAIRSRFKLDADFLTQAQHLKCIGRAGAGMENIDLAVATKYGIQCVNAPEGNRDAVAEHAMGMLLMLMNHLRRADNEVRNGIWKREENRGTEIEGKTVGIVGFGNMGSSFARRLQGFGVRVLALDPYKTIDIKMFPYVEQCTEELFYKECDIVSLHIPLTKETYFLANDNWFNNFRKPIYFINTARGKNTETAALVRAMERGKVTGAALDVLEYEAVSFEHIDASKLPEPFSYLIHSDRVVLSPHIAGWTHESNEKIARILAEKMVHVLKT